MMKGKGLVLLVIAVLVIVFAIGCVKASQKDFEARQPKLTEKTKTVFPPKEEKEKNTTVFDQNNFSYPVDQNELIQEIQDKNQVTEPITQKQSSEPVPLSWVLPFKVSEKYDPATRSQGDISFAGFWVIVPFAGNLYIQDYADYWNKGNNPDIWFEVRPGTVLRASVSGKASVGLNPVDPKSIEAGLNERDWEMSIQIGDGPYWIEYDHIIDVLVKDGDVVEKGQPLARASPASTRHGGSEGKKPVDEFEWGLRLGGNPPKGICPLPFLEKSEQEKLESVLKTMQSLGFKAKETVCLAQEVS